MRRARRTRPRRPVTVMRVFKVPKKKRRIRRKFDTAQATISTANIPLALGAIGARLVSPLVLAFFFVFALSLFVFRWKGPFLVCCVLHFVHLLQSPSRRSRFAEVNPVWIDLKISYLNRSFGDVTVVLMQLQYTGSPTLH